MRDALGDHVHVGVRELHDGVPPSPRLTIAIPTFRRPALLLEAIRSAMAQRGAGPFEILVVDNDPLSHDWAQLAGSTPDLADAPIRYLVNDENIGMLGNWNRCIAMARGEWLTILNDDDLLDPDFAATMLAMLQGLEAAGLADGLVCGKRMLDEREDEPGHAPRRRLSAWLAGARARLVRTLSRSRRDRRLTARQMFWGNPAGNPVGFLCRTALFREIGGFYPEEYPSADYFFFTRLALHHRLRQTGRILASIRVGENESMREEVLYGFLRTEYRIQQALAATVLPRWWGRISPWLVGQHVKGIERMWRVTLDPMVVRQQVGMLHRTGHHRWLYAVRAILGGL